MRAVMMKAVAAAVAIATESSRPPPCEGHGTSDSPLAPDICRYMLHSSFSGTILSKVSSALVEKCSTACRWLGDCRDRIVV
jgi:hypothetical protein